MCFIRNGYVASLLLNEESMENRPSNATQLLTQVLDDSDAIQRATALLTWAYSPRRLVQMSSRQLLDSGLLGVHEAKRLQSAFQFFIRALTSPLPPCLARPSDVAKHMVWLSLESDEGLWTVNVGPALRPLSVREIARGSPAKCWSDLSDILRPALSVGATGLFMIHNHPTGDSTPSQQDIEFTKKVHARSQWLGLELHDHLVLGGLAWTSCISGAKGRVAELSVAPPMESPRNALRH
jgi:DNA repair protein RadC